MAERVRVREIDDDEGKRLVRIVRRGSGATSLIARYSVAALGSDRELPGVGALADDHVPIQIGAIHPGSVSAGESEGAYGRVSVRIAT